MTLGTSCGTSHWYSLFLCLNGRIVVSCTVLMHSLDTSSWNWIRLWLAACSGPIEARLFFFSISDCRSFNSIRCRQRILRSSVLLNNWHRFRLGFIDGCSNLVSNCSCWCFQFSKTIKKNSLLYDIWFFFLQSHCFSIIQINTGITWYFKLVIRHIFWSLFSACHIWKSYLYIRMV